MLYRWSLHRSSGEPIKPWKHGMRRFVAALCIPAVALLLAIWLCGSADAHGAFYPHHLQDLGALRSRTDLKITVLISTGIFVLLLGTVITLAIKKGQLDSDKVEHDHHKRLRLGTEAAAKAALQAWPHDARGALSAALEAYAHVAHVQWHAELVEGQDMPLRCRLGEDELLLRSHGSEEGAVMQITASCRDRSVGIAITPQGEIHEHSDGASEG